MVEFLIRNFQTLYLQGGRSGLGQASKSIKAPATQRLKAEKEAFGTLNSQRNDQNGNGPSDSARYQSSKQKGAAQLDFKLQKPKDGREQKSSASRNRIREQTGAASAGQSENLNQTYTSLRSQVRKDVDPLSRGRSQKGRA